MEVIYGSWKSSVQKRLKFVNFKKIYKTNVCVKVRGNSLITKRYSECLTAPMRTMIDHGSIVGGHNQNQNRKSEKCMDVTQ